MQQIPATSVTQWNEALTLYNLTDPAIIVNPYPWYEAIRHFGPIYFDETVGWVCTGFAESEQILKDEKRFAVVPPVPPRSDTYVTELLGHQMIFVGGAEHRRVRHLLAKRLLSKSKQFPWQASLLQVATDMLMPFKEQAREEMDLVSDYAGRLPTLLVLELLGLPVQDLEQIMGWNDGYEVLLGLPSSDMEDAQRKVREETAYFTAVVAERRQHPGNDLISDMIAANLDDQQIVANCVVLAAGGYETTTHLITMALYWLNQFPEQHQRLRETPTLLAPALKEVMRFDGSSQFLARRATTDTVIGGQIIRAGETLFVLLPAANRDERQFAHPDRFDIGRSIDRHLGFGAGPHACLGGPVAERLAELAVRLFLDLFPDFSVTVPYAELPWKLLHSNVRCVEHLPVRL